MEKGVNFPTQWDKTNKYALLLFKRCKEYYKFGEEEKLYKSFIPSSLFHVICIIVIIYSIISLIFVIIRRDAYAKIKSNVNLSIIFSVGTIINVTSLYMKRVNFIIYANIYNLIPYNKLNKNIF